MICDPCKQGIHTRGPNKVEITSDGSMVFTGPKVCKGGTWCDCQHRRRVREAAELVVAKDAELLERLA